jgi:sugar lactone lactonase YvrE
MSNNKDFVVNGPVVIGKDTKVTVGSITSSDIGLSTGNYFDDTLAANTTYTLSNAGDVQAFQLEVTGGVGESWVLSNASYSGVNLDTSGQQVLAYGIAFKTDGTAMYVCGSSPDSVFQYTLSTAWDLSTASYASKTKSVTSEDTDPTGLFFKSDGTKMYVVGRTNDRVYQYTLSTAWDVSTASYDSVFLSVSSQDTSPWGIYFKSDGLEFYLVGDSNDRVRKYTLTTAWDLSTASYANVEFLVSTPTSEGQPNGIFFKSDGTKMFICGSQGDKVYELSLSTAWDITTASYNNITFDVSGQETAPRGVAFSSDGDRMYIVGANGGGDVHEYTGTTTDATLTWPSSIEWAGGIAPAAPANGETDVFTFTTDDGGTTYTGVKSIDNAS